MSSKGFAHLHLHSEYSLLDGAIAIKKLLKHCNETQMDSVAVTDHGNMFGAVDFYMKSHAAGIRPIIGTEAYIAPGSRFDKQKSGIKDAAFHLVLLAENNVGYHNLLKLSSTGFLDGFYYRPRIDKQILAELKEGLICTSACIGGEVASLLSKGDEKKAREAVESYVKIFGTDRYFIEIQRHGPLTALDTGPFHDLTIVVRTAASPNVMPRTGTGAVAQIICWEELIR